MNLPKDRTERLKYLAANKKDLIEFKKSSFKMADSFGSNRIEKQVCKALNTNYQDDIESGIITRKIIGNTYLWMDSHDDVHLPNLFSKSVKEREGKIWHLHDHLKQITAKVGEFKEVVEEDMLWTDLGVNKAGSTQVLSAVSDISKKRNESIFEDYLKGFIDQHSVGMYYVKIDLAINDPDEKEAFALYNSLIDRIGNRSKVEEQGFFWAVKEAKLIEISAVLEGSNEITQTIVNQPPLGTDSEKSRQSHIDTQEKAKLELYKSLIIN